MAQSRPALPAPRTVMDSLALQPLDQHKDMKRVVVKLQDYYWTVIKNTFTIEVVETHPEPLSIDLIVWEIMQFFLPVLRRILREQKVHPVKNLFDAVWLVGLVLQHNWSMTKVFSELFDGMKTKIKVVMTSLIDHLRSYSLALENLFLHYTVKEREIQKPSFIDIERCVDFVLGDVKALKQYKWADYKEKLPTEIRINPEDWIYCMLGLSPQSIKQLNSIPDDTKQHQIHEYWIQQLISDNSSSQEHTCSDEYPFSLDSFVNIGITESVADWLLQSLVNNPFKNHQTPDYWVNRYIEQMYEVMLNKVPRYPYSEDVGNWEKRVTENEETGEDGMVYQQMINYINIPTNSKSLKKDRAPYPPPSTDEFHIFCHGTDHQSAVDIAENGIDLAKGRERQDFSNGHGFYLNPKFDQACQWAKLGRFKQYAVVVYKIPKQVIEIKKVLDLWDEGEVKWKQVIKDNRMGISRKKSKQKYNMDFIRGPMCHNQHEVVKCPPEGYNTETPQYCILSDAMAEDLDKFVDAVIFF